MIGWAEFLYAFLKGAPLPEWDKIRVCANAVISGREEGDWLIVDTINPANIPTWTELQWTPWLYFEAVSTTASGGTTPFPQGGGAPVYIPLVAQTEVRFPLVALEKNNGNV